MDGSLDIKGDVQRLAQDYPLDGSVVTTSVGSKRTRKERGPQDEDRDIV